MNKVNVNIYGKEYTVVGEQNAERIARIAAHVDGKMNEIAEAAGANIPVSSVAVLSAMEITEECFTQMDRIEELNRQVEQGEADSQHYMQLWEEAKNSSLEYKQDSQQEIAELKEINESLRARVAEAEKEAEDARRTKESELAEVQRTMESELAEVQRSKEAELAEFQRNKEAEWAELQRTKDQELEEAYKMQQQVQETFSEEAGREMAEAKRQYSDLENSYFDLQMENIRLKSEIEKLKAKEEQQPVDVFEQPEYSRADIGIVEQEPVIEPMAPADDPMAGVTEDSGDDFTF